MYDFYDEDRYDRTATEAEAHAEWHLNAGVPMGTPGCPWDACHDDDPDYDPPAATEEQLATIRHAIATGRHGAGDTSTAPYDDDDVPF